MSATQITIVQEDPESPAAKACLRAYFALLAERIPGITSGQLPAGQRLAAHLAFDVPAGEAIVQITLRDPKGEPLAAWSFA